MNKMKQVHVDITDPVSLRSSTDSRLPFSETLLVDAVADAFI